MIDPSGRTTRLDTPRENHFFRDAACIFSATGSEERSRLPVWGDRLKVARDTCAEILEEGDTTFLARLPNGEESGSLKNPADLAKLFLGFSRAYIDISGMAHSTWAPVVRTALSLLKNVNVVYCEPKQYRPHPSPSSSTLYDLSQKIGGVAPLPGFANLRGPVENQAEVFVPMLGFEGMRARQVAESLDPLPPHIVPIIGLPGFRLEYPFIAISCNQAFLDDARAHERIRFARASCPFETYNLLCEIQREFANAYLYLAPIGTKPQALGAVWFSIDHPVGTELMYDHPKRRPQRTHGVGQTHVYRLK